MPAAGLRARLAVRFPDLVVGAGSADAQASRDRARLRHFFPDHWDGVGDTYSIAQHVDDVIGFIEKLDTRPVDLMGHSRGGHICFRVAQRRPDLLRKLILAEPGGELDATLDPAYKPGPSPLAARIAASAEVIAKGDIDGGLQIFMDALEGPGAWKRLPATPKQLLRDNATTLIGQMRDQRPPFSKSDAEAIKTPTLFIGGANTKGTLPQVLLRWRELCRVAHRDDPGHHASDVRAGAAEILRDRAGFSGGVSAPRRVTSDRAATRHPNRRGADWPENPRRVEPAPCDGPSPGTASSAAWKARRASSQRRAR